MTYVANRFYPAMLPGATVQAQADFPAGVLHAVPFNIVASFAPLTLSIAKSDGRAFPDSAATVPGTSPPVPYPAAVLTIHAVGANGRPSGAPVGSSGIVGFGRNEILTAPLPGQAALAAGAYFAIVKLLGGGTAWPFPLLSVAGSGAAVVLGQATIAKDTRSVAALVLATTPDAPMPTFTGNEAWADVPGGLGAPLVYLGS